MDDLDVVHELDQIALESRSAGHGVQHPIVGVLQDIANLPFLEQLIDITLRDGDGAQAGQQVGGGLRVELLIGRSADFVGERAKLDEGA